MRARPRPDKAGGKKLSYFPLLASDCQERIARSGGSANLPAATHIGQQFICILKALGALRQVSESRVNLLGIARHMSCGTLEIGFAYGIADANVHCSQVSFPAQ